jgi:hypothetical protein
MKNVIFLLIFQKRLVADAVVRDFGVIGTCRQWPFRIRGPARYGIANQGGSRTAPTTTNGDDVQNTERSQTVPYKETNNRAETSPAPTITIFHGGIYPHTTDWAATQGRPYNVSSVVIPACPESSFDWIFMPSDSRRAPLAGMTALCSYIATT